MNETTILVLILTFVASAFAMTVLRMYIVTHQDVKLGQRVNGLSIDVGKIKKQLRDGLQPVVMQNPGNVEMPADVSNMSLEDAVEMFGLDAKDLNNPIVRPIAEKILEKIKAKSSQKDQPAESNIEML